jgi:hypothetical protein
MTLRAIAETGGASSPARSMASGPWAAICRPSSPSSHGFPPTARWHSRHGRRGLGRQAADELRGAAGRQPLRVQHDGRAHAGEQAEQVGRGARVVAAGPDGDQQRQVVDPPSQIGEHLQRGAVGPLRVVDHERERALLGEGRAQPQHAVGDQHRRVCAGDVPPKQQRAGQGRGPVDQLRALGVGLLAQRGLEQRAHDAEGEVALQGARLGAAHETAGLGGGQGGVLQQGRLAEPRGRIEHDDPAVALGHAADGAAEHLEVDRALDQRRVAGDRRGLCGHDAQMGCRATTRGTDHVRCGRARARNLPAVVQRPPERKIE